MNNSGHGMVGRREQQFTNLLPLRANAYVPEDLKNLSAMMKSDPDTVKDGADPEENLWVPAGYTYFGQFIDHDLTFDSTSSLDPNSDAQATNLRTPRFDLDCLYGDGPGAQPYMYDAEGVKLLERDNSAGPDQSLAKRDLLRTAHPHDRAIIGDKRNDENSIVCQIQLAFIKYHNQVVEKLRTEKPALQGNELFTAARNYVRWTYQKLVIEDFLPRIVNKDVFANLALPVTDKVTVKDNVGRRAKNYALYSEDKRYSLPLEFVGAAYRFGHSGVRAGYRLNGLTGSQGGRFSIFPASTDETSVAGKESLLGFDALPSSQEIDNWGRFFPDTLPSKIPQTLGEKGKETPEVPNVRLQYAYKIDTSIVDPLGALPRKEVAGEDTTKEAEALVKLPPTEGKPPKGTPTRPSLALLNLFRGNEYRIASGQDFARALKAKGFPCDVLKCKYLSVRVPAESEDGTEGSFFKFKEINSGFHTDTPLWFYILAEAQASLVDALGGVLGDEVFNEDKMLDKDGAKTQLGWVGGRIVAEVFYGLIDSDPDSYVNAAPNDWKPFLGGDGNTIVRNLLKFADPNNS